MRREFVGRINGTLLFYAFSYVNAKPLDKLLKLLHPDLNAVTSHTLTDSHTDVVWHLCCLLLVLSSEKQSSVSGASAFAHGLSLLVRVAIEGSNFLKFSSKCEKTFAAACGVRKPT